MSACHSISGTAFLATTRTRPSGRVSKGKKNGDLPRAAEVASYEVMLTVDQGIPHQTYPADRKLSIILVRSRTNQIVDLLPLVDMILQALETIQPGQTVAISSSD